MASLIPKIKVGLASNKREKHNLSFDCSTTSNIGNIQPTMCREMTPKTTFKCKVSSLVRLAAMPTPTFGRMSLRHYHCFVPIADLWQPFDAMLSGQHYSDDGDTWIPTHTPYFTMQSIFAFVNSYSDISYAPASDVTKPLTITTTNVDYTGKIYTFGQGGDYASELDAIEAAQEADRARLESAFIATKGRACYDGTMVNPYWFGWQSDHRGGLGSDEMGVINAGDYYCAAGYNTGVITFAHKNAEGNLKPYPAGNTPITAEGADLITLVNGYYILVKFKAPVKRLRTILIGLGYQFSPYNSDMLNPLKILAYYKCWFNLFSPKRERSFNDTPCYKLIKYGSTGNQRHFSGGDWTELILELMLKCYYFLPQDYFSMSVSKPATGNQDNAVILNSGYGYVNGQSGPTWSNINEVTVRPQVDDVRADLPITYTSSPNPMTVRLADRLLTWTSKNTVLGRSIRDYLKVHFGITDVNQLDDGGVYRIGASRTDIKISDVMSTADTDRGALGEYAGRGIGFGDSDKFEFTADKFGYWITLTAVVPESGYYQGYLRENRHLSRFDFYNPEFDAIGYQVLERGEVMDDYTCDSDTFKPANNYERTNAFGFVPRYSEYKVGRNIVNGDLSLQGLYHTMAPYTLERRMATGALIGSTPDILTGHVRQTIGAPSFIPSVIYDGFRRIDPTDHLGQYNRIFNYGNNDLDHFIINNIFDVVAYSPMKSLSESFDTTLEDEKTTEITHS